MKHNDNKPTIGILGAGKLSMVIAQLEIKAGYKVYIAGSGDREKIRLSVTVIAPVQYQIFHQKLSINQTSSY